MDEKSLNLERLMKLRLVVARHGEMDLAAWWNTNGMLGRRGQLVLKRGFPSTHSFAQARVVFEVARSRCKGERDGGDARRVPPPVTWSYLRRVREGAEPVRIFVSWPPEQT